MKPRRRWGPTPPGCWLSSASPRGALTTRERLLDGVEDQPITAVAQARLHLATGRMSTAATLVRRRLRQVGEHELERFVLLDLLAETGAEDVAAVDEESLGDVAGAYASRARGRAALTADATDAHRALEDALARFGACALIYECARTRVVLAEVTSRSDRDVAVSEARIALSAFEQLGADRDADAAAALLRTLGARAARAVAARDCRCSPGASARCSACSAKGCRTPRSASGCT